LSKRAPFLTVLTAAATLGALVACGPASAPTPLAKTGTTGGATATTPSAGAAVTTRPAGAASPSAAMTGTPAAATSGTPGAAGAGTPAAGATGTPMTGTTGAAGAATGTPMAGTTGAAGAATGTPMAGTTGAGAMATGTPAATTGMTGAATATPMAGSAGAGAMATGTPTTGMSGVAATATPMAGTSGTGAMTGMPQIRIMQSISLQNPTPLAIDMSGWKLRIGSQTVSLPSNARVGPSETVTIHFGEGTSQGNDIFLGSQSQQMTTALRPGARVMLENPQGQTVTDFALPA
jgi:hypothetical protein